MAGAETPGTRCRLSSRPSPRAFFLEPERRLEVGFYTSNLAKFLQARAVFEKHGILVRHFRSKADPYQEDHTLGTRALLENALQEITRSVGKGSIFFVEDTSVKIEALSRPGFDFPGLRVKEWFSDTSCEELDAELNKRGDNREAEVRSDIGLHIPGLPRPVFFGAATRGVVADSPPAFEESPQHPWLTPHSFNGWFVPMGTSKPLGAMDFEGSLEHDFRAEAFQEVINRLEEYSAVLNLPPSAYSRRPSVATPSVATRTNQGRLFPGSYPLLLIVGYTCAGKTTFGEFARKVTPITTVEASSVLRLIASEQGIVEENLFDLAVETLGSQGADAVARRILEDYDVVTGLVITGLRTIEEVETIRGNFPDAKVVFVDASERTRFERLVHRARDGSPTTLEGLKELDMKQAQFGLPKVAEHFADLKVVNEGTLQEYGGQVEAIIRGKTRDSPGVQEVDRSQYASASNQLLRCLKVLAEKGRPLTTGEIEAITSQRGQRVRQNNANKVLKAVPFLSRRLESTSGRLRYQILPSGIAYVSLAGQLAPDMKRS